MSEIESIIKEYSEYLYRYALFLSGHPDQAQELVQRTWIKVWGHLDQLQDSSALTAWLRKICLNEFRMMHRCKHPCESIDELTADSHLFIDQRIDPITELTVSEEVRQLRNGCFLAMARKLTLQQRMAFSLVDMFGLSLQEAALLMDTSVSAIKGLLYRARMNLDSFFADHCIYIKDNNACRCESWIQFTHQRNEMQIKLKSAFSALEFKEKGYVYQEAVRARVSYYYQHMPITAPDPAWYEELICIIKNKSTSVI